MNSSITFTKAVRSGEACESDIDDWIEYWYDTPALDVELHEYLGMTSEQYDVWLEQPEMLFLIIADDWNKSE